MADIPQENTELAAARRSMVQEQLRARGITSAEVLHAMGSLARERFVPASLESAAYDDRALPVGNDQTISQPFIVGYMTQALDVRPGQRVLEVGTGTGYQTALLCMLGAEVYSIERIASLLEAAQRRLADLGVGSVRLHCGDGSLGWAEHAPYDRIIVTAGAPEVPPALVEQLAVTGRLVIPIGGPGHQTLVLIEKRDGRTVETSLLPCRFVHLIGKQAWGE